MLEMKNNSISSKFYSRGNYVKKHRYPSFVFKIQWQPFCLNGVFLSSLYYRFDVTHELNEHFVILCLTISYHYLLILQMRFRTFNLSILNIKLKR